MTPLVLLPGIEGDARIWNPTRAAWSERLSLPMELPGGAEDLHQLAAELLQKFYEGQFFIAGLSLGGLVARAMAEQAPDMVRGLVMIGSLPGREFLPHRVRWSGKMLSLLPKGTFSALYQRRINRRLVQEGVDEQGARELCKRLPMKEVYLQRLGAIQRWGLSPEITVPSLLLRGADEREAPWSLDQARQALPGVLVEEVPGGHRAPWTHPQALAARIAGFMAEVEGRS